MTANWINVLESTDSGRRALEQERLIIQATEAIASLMTEQKVSRADLAKRIGKSPAFVTKILRGDNNFTLRTLSDVLFVLNRSAHLSLGEIGEQLSLCRTAQPKTVRLSMSEWPRKNGSWPATRRPGTYQGAAGKELAA